MRFVSKSIFIASFLVFAGVGCIQFQQSGASGRDGGVWKTADRGVHWQQKVIVPTAAGLGSISNLSVARIIADPQDHQALYLATSDDGLFYSYDGGESWMRQKQIAAGRVQAISIDAKDKCTIYVALGQRVWKSTDCSRSYEPIYFESRGDQGMTAVVVDWFNTNTVYAGTTAGDILKSSDGGRTWAAVKRFSDRIQQFYMDPFDSRILYVGMHDAGIWKTTDGGASWTDMTLGLNKFDSAHGLVIMVGDRVTRDLLFIATKYGLIRSTDGGVTWNALSLPTPPGSVDIHSLAVNPKNGNELYYGTNSTFYRTTNGGANWSTEKLPSTRAATALLVDTDDANVVYMGMTLFKK